MNAKIAAFLLISFGAVGLLAQEADNSGVNKAEGQPTADQARNSKSDREIMQSIRKSIMNDKSLSTYGHNVKIISQHGKVTLRGPVHSDGERKSIVDKADVVAGAGNVTDNLTVKGDTGPK
jgi:osmotically-inducible protein OsmY